MKFVNLSSINNKLIILVIFALLPDCVILLYSGLEQRQQSIEKAKQDILLLTQAMAEVQFDLTNATRQILSTLSLLPEIQTLNLQASSEIFKAVLAQNPSYNNMVLIDLNGEVLIAGKTFTGKNLADRKHVQEALSRKTFAVGEYIISRAGEKRPIFAFAHPVFDNKGEPKAILTTAVKLNSFSRFHDLSTLPEKSFVAITDHQGIRLFYYPSQNETNPVGAPIHPKSWNIASQTTGPGIFTSTGSDGLRRIFAFEQVRLSPEDTPYLYVWAGVPEPHILAPANAVLRRNLLLMLLATVISLFLAWMLGKNTLLSPIQNLVKLTRRYSQGVFRARCEFAVKDDEFGTLTEAFYNMAETLEKNQRTLEENEARFRLLMDSFNELVYVADMNTYEILFINEYGKKEFGDIVGKICWQTLQAGQEGPCAFCTNKYLLGKDGNPGEIYTWEGQHSVTKKWMHIIDRAIIWSDGRVVKLEIATDLSARKQEELIKNALIEKLENALVEIKTLQGILPICSYCKNIRNDDGYYEQIESYIHKHSGIDFSHTICPKCLEKHYPEESARMALATRTVKT